MKQSFTWWSFSNQGLGDDELLKTAADIGYTGVEILEEALFLRAQANGLSIITHRAFNTLEEGLNQKENHAGIFKEFEYNLKLAEKWKIPTLICFSGNRNGLSDEAGIEVIVEGLRPMVKLAEGAGVTLVLELLNSKVDHPDYQSDRTAFGVKVVDLVGSRHFKLLYDIYHMQIMEGDIVRTIETHSDYFGHYHTAGNPGRNEIGAGQELNYASIFEAIKKTDYDGFVGHEFTPTGDVIKALQEAFDICSGMKSF